MKLIKPIKLFNQAILPIFCMMFLSACSTVHSRLVLDDDFVKQSEKLIPHRPKILIPDSVYEQDFDNYRVTNVDKSSTRSSSDLINNERDIKIFVESLSRITIGQLTTSNFQVDGRQSFSFDLQDKSQIGPNNKLIRSSCTTTFINEKIVYKYNRFFGNTSTSSSEHRLNTVLRCSIEQNDTLWKLELVSDLENNLVASLENQDQHFELKPIMQADRFIMEDKQEKMLEHPARSDRNSGLSILNNGLQIAAVSFIDKNSIHIRRDLLPAEKALMLSVTYNLIMFDWTTKEWRS